MFVSTTISTPVTNVFQLKFSDAKRYAIKHMPWLHGVASILCESLYTPERMARALLGRSKLLEPRLQVYGRKIHSQNDEDGVLEHIFYVLGPSRGYFVEIGVGPPRDGRDIKEGIGLECNCRLLSENGWSGLLLDAGDYPASLGVTRAFVTAENINQLLDENGVPDEIDLLSIDIDGNDYWVWKALRRKPRVVVVEYNASIPADESKTIVYDPAFNWAAGGCTKYYGASLLALTRLGIERGYTLVYANGVNAFFVDTSFLPNADAFQYRYIYRYADRHAPLRGDEVWIGV